MATSRQVTCIKKNNKLSRHERITHIGGNWNSDGSLKTIAESQAISDIENDDYTYYV